MMKWFKWIITPLLALCFLVSGCNFSKPAEKPAAPPVKEQNFVVYRVTGPDQGYLVTEKHTIKDNGKPVAENALRTLVEVKPQDVKLANIFPEGTKVLGLNVKDGIASADFSKELKKIGGGSYTELLVTGSIVNTLTEFPEIKKVQIMIEGRKIVTLNGHMDLLDPLERDTSLFSAGQKNKTK